MNDSGSLSYTLWECKHHVIWTPKYRRKAIYDQLRKYLGSAFRDIAAQKESQVMEGHLCPDHVHMLISIPPKYAVSQVVGFIKGKSAIHIARNFRDIARILLASISGPEVIMFPLSEETKRPSENTSGNRSRKIVASINSICSRNNHLQVVQHF